jgi:hypothetical protein
VLLLSTHTGFKHLTAAQDRQSSSVGEFWDRSDGRLVEKLERLRCRILVNDQYANMLGQTVIMYNILKQ